MVQFQNVSKKFPNGLHAVEDISFVVDEGEFVFLIGPSGSGKTTIIDLLIRDKQPTTGKVFLNDTDVTNISRNKIYKLRRQIGVIFQDYKLINYKNAYENVAFAMEAAGKKDKEIKEAVPYVLDVVGLGHRMDAFPVQLSGGERQRVAIARAIANNPKLLIADEPTGNLDPASAWDIVQILTKINNWGTTVIMSTHGTDIVNTLNKRVIQMEKGKIVRDDNRGGYEFSDKVDLQELEDLLREHPEVSNKHKSIVVDINSSDNKPNAEEGKVKKTFFQWLFRRGPQDGEGADDGIISNEELQRKFLEDDVKEDIETEILEETIIAESVVEDDEKISNIKQDQEAQEVVEEKSSENKKTDKKKKSKKDKKMHLDLSETESSVKLASFREKKENLSKDVDSKKIKQLQMKPLSFLHLPGSLIKKLEGAGYSNINEVLEVGPEKLSEDSIIDDTEIIMLAKSLEKLLDK